MVRSLTLIWNKSIFHPPVGGSHSPDRVLQSRGQPRRVGGRRSAPRRGATCVFAKKRKLHLLSKLHCQRQLHLRLLAQVGGGASTPQKTYKYPRPFFFYMPLKNRHAPCPAGEQKITRAKELLRYSNASIEEIASLCGIDDASYFNKVFKKLEGCTASEYRKRW